MEDEPVFTLEKLTDFVWGTLRAIGVIASLMAMLWFLGQVSK